MNVPPPDFTTYAFYADPSISDPADAVVNQVVRTASRSAEDSHRDAATVMVPSAQPDEDAYEGTEMEMGHLS